MPYTNETTVDGKIRSSIIILSAVTIVFLQTRLVFVIDGMLFLPYLIYYTN